MKISVFFDHILQAHEQTKTPIAALLVFVRDCGVQAVEINLDYLTKHPETPRLLSDAGLDISCIWQFYAMESRDEREKCMRHIQAAAKNGAEKVLVVPGFFDAAEAAKFSACIHDYNQTAAFLDASAAAQNMASGLSFITALGEQNGVTVTVEDFDDKKSPLASVNGLRWFFGRIPALRATFDTGNFIIHNEDIFTAFALLRDRIVHVHCKDRADRPVAVGDGHIPVARLVRQLAETGYDGYFAIEHFDANNQTECIRRSASFLIDLFAKNYV